MRFEDAVRFCEEVHEIGAHEREAKDTAVHGCSGERQTRNVTGDDVFARCDEVEPLPSLDDLVLQAPLPAPEVCDGPVLWVARDAPGHEVERHFGPFAHLRPEACMICFEELGISSE